MSFNREMTRLESGCAPTIAGQFAQQGGSGVTVQEFVVGNQSPCHDVGIIGDRSQDGRTQEAVALDMPREADDRLDDRVERRLAQ